MRNFLLALLTLIEARDITLRRQAEDRLGPDVPPTEVYRYFTAFPPLTSNGHMRRLEAAQAVSPNDVKRLAASIHVACLRVITTLPW